MKFRFTVHVVWNDVILRIGGCTQWEVRMASKRGTHWILNASQQERRSSFQHGQDQGPFTEAPSG